MPHFMITYLGGEQPTTPEEGKKHFEEYQKWLASLGEALISPMNPIKDTSTIHSNGSVVEGTITSMSGFTIIQADHSDEAIKMAKNCPFLDIGGSLEVSEMMNVKS